MKSSSRNNFFQKKKQQQQQQQQTVNVSVEAPTSTPITPSSATHEPTALTTSNKPVDFSAPVRKRGRPPLHPKKGQQPTAASTVQEVQQQELTPTGPSDNDLATVPILSVQVPEVETNVESNTYPNPDADEDAQQHDPDEEVGESGLATVDIIPVPLIEASNEFDVDNEDNVDPLTDLKPSEQQALEERFDEEPYEEQDPVFQKPLNMPISPRSPRVRANMATAMYSTSPEITTPFFTRSSFDSEEQVSALDTEAQSEETQVLRSSASSEHIDQQISMSEDGRSENQFDENENEPTISSETNGQQDTPEEQESDKVDIKRETDRNDEGSLNEEDDAVDDVLSDPSDESHEEFELIGAMRAVPMMFSSSSMFSPFSENLHLVTPTVTVVQAQASPMNSHGFLIKPSTAIIEVEDEPTTTFTPTVPKQSFPISASIPILSDESVTSNSSLVPAHEPPAPEKVVLSPRSPRVFSPTTVPNPAPKSVMSPRISHNVADTAPPVFFREVDSVTATSPSLSDKQPSSSASVFREALLQAKQSVDAKLHKMQIQLLQQQHCSEEIQQPAPACSKDLDDLQLSELSNRAVRSAKLAMNTVRVSPPDTVKSPRRVSNSANVHSESEAVLSNLSSHNDSERLAGEQKVDKQGEIELVENTLQSQIIPASEEHSSENNEGNEDENNGEDNEEDENIGEDNDEDDDRADDDRADDRDDEDVVYVATDEDYWHALESNSIVELNEYDKQLLLRYRIASILDSETPVHLVACKASDNVGHLPGSLSSQRKLMDWWIAGVFMNREEKLANAATNPHRRPTEALHQTPASSSAAVTEIIRSGNVPLTIHTASEREMFVSLYAANKLRRWSPCFAYSYGGVFTRNGGASSKCVVFEAPISGRSMRDLLPSLILSDIVEIVAWTYDALLLAFDKIQFSHGNLDLDHVYLTKLPGTAATSYLPTIVGYEQSSFVEDDSDNFIGPHARESGIDQESASRVVVPATKTPLIERHGPPGNLLTDMIDLVVSIENDVDQEMQKSTAEQVVQLRKQLQSIERKCEGDFKAVMKRLTRWREALEVPELHSVTSIGGLFRVHSRVDIDTESKWRLNNESEVEDLCRTTSTATSTLLRRQFSNVFTNVGAVASLCENIPWVTQTRIVARLKPLPGETRRRTRAHIIAIELHRRLELYRQNGSPDRVRDLLDVVRRYLPGQSGSQSQSVSHVSVSHASSSRPLH